MKILFLGGSRFIGKHTVLEAARRGHEVTLFNRGSTPPPLESAGQVTGDRNRDLELLAGERFDAVIDTSAYVPRQVTEAARVLSGNVGTYLFISTVSVYASLTEPDLDEDAELQELEDPDTEEVTGATYGGLKVLCERALEAGFPGRRLVIRPGVVAGPDDPTDRFTYWPVRVEAGGEVLAPGGPHVTLQYIDVRDLARFLVHGLERELEGTFNAVGPQVSFEELILGSKEVTGSDARPVWVSEEFLLEREVAPFSDLPLWLPGDDTSFDSSRAVAAGLEFTPIENTVRATLDWYRSSGAAPLKAGLSRDRELRLLAEWHERNGGL